MSDQPEIVTTPTEQPQPLKAKTSILLTDAAFTISAAEMREYVSKDRKCNALKRQIALRKEQWVKGRKKYFRMRQKYDARQQKIFNQLHGKLRTRKKVIRSMQRRKVMAWASREFAKRVLQEKGIKI